MTTSSRTKTLGAALRRHQRGSALIMALLVVLVLTGLGLVGLRHTMFEIRQSSNARFAKQADYTAETGMMGAQQRVGRLGQAYWDYMVRFNKERKRQFGVDEVPIYPFDDAEFLTNGHVFGLPQGSFETEQDTDASFTVELTDPRQGVSPPGFSKEYCFVRFTFQTTGQVGVVDNNLRWDDPVRFSQSRMRSHTVVGPLLCDQGAGL